MKKVLIIFYFIFYSVFLLLCFDIFFQFFLNKRITIELIEHKKAIDVFERVVRDSETKRVFSDIPAFQRIVDVEFNKFLPLGQISNSKIIHCEENGYISNYESSHYGFNTKYKITNITLIGDSYVEGACVNYKDTLAGNIEKKSKFKINNLGISGSSLLYQYATLKEYLEEDSNVVLIFLENGDLVEIRNELDHPILYNYFLNENFTQNLKNKQVNIDFILKQHHEKESKKFFKNNYNFKSKLKRFIINNHFLYSLTFPVFRNLIKDALKLNTNQKDKKQKINDNDLKNFEKMIKKLNNFINQKNGKLIFIYLPAIQRLLNQTNQFDGVYENIEKILLNNNISYYDLGQDIINFSDPKKLYSLYHNKYKFKNNMTFGHFNELGYDFISDIILKKLN